MKMSQLREGSLRRERRGRPARKYFIRKLAICRPEFMAVAHPLPGRRDCLLAGVLGEGRELQLELSGHLAEGWSRS